MGKKDYKVYRCGFFDTAGEEEIITLRNMYGIRNIIDFNNSPSRHRYLSRFFSYENVEMYNKKIDIPSVNEYLDNYIDLVENNKDHIGKIVTELINSTECPTLIGCKFGKDRTGIISAILLNLAGVSEDIIEEDYNTTLINLKNISWIFSEHWKKRNISKEEYIKRFDIDKRVISSLLEYVNITYGSIPEYLLECGVKKEDIDFFSKAE